MFPLLLTASGAFGLAIGSFLNVVIYRVPNGRSVVRPASACPGCGAEIAPRDNVPLLSWILLRGRCRGCHERISVRYPLIEALTGLAFVVVGLAFLPGVLRAVGGEQAANAIALVVLLYLASISVALTMIDLDVHRLPDRIVLPSYLVIVLPLVVAAIIEQQPARIAVGAIGLGASFLFYGVIWLVQPGGMGFGDVKLAGVLGFALGWLGWSQLAVGVAGAFVLGGVFAIALLLLRRAGRRSQVPFGPWMFAGAWLGILAGEPIARAYLSLTGLG